MAKRKPVPMSATEREFRQMGRDHVQSGNFCIMADSRRVWLSEQKRGQDRTQRFEISRRRFNTLLAWYTDGIVPHSRRKRK